MKGKTKSKIAVKLIVAILVMSVFLALGSVGTISSKADSPNEYFSGGVGRYQTDYNSKEESLAAANALNRQIMLEGAVLLKNDDLLPVARNTKVSLLGNPAAFIVPAGGGSAAVTGERIVNPGNINDNWFDAFTWDGGFDVNPQVRAFYESTASGPNSAASTTNLNLATSEPTPAMINGYNGANDLGIVFFSRMGAEGGDLNRAAASGRQRHWLALHDGEIRLLDWANDNFQNVIVVINSSNVLEVGFLNDPAYPNIKAAFHVGQPGTQSFFEFPRLLRADGVSPSGRMVNTLNKDFTEDPSYQNFAGNTGMDITDGTADYYIGSSRQTGYVGVEYEEGIYLGYRYWETRGLTEYKADGDWDWYEDRMNYPFGYGLSYTTFDWEILNSTPISRNGNIRVQVKVTNTGDIASKDVVQMYYTAPYISGGIEKAHVNLGAFAKTSLLNPDEFDIVTLDMPVRTMASWDYKDANGNGTKGAYEMDAGQYMVSIARNAHDAAVMAAEPTVANPLRIDYNLASTWIYDTDDTTGTELKNLFEESNQYVLGDDHDDGDLYGIGSQMTVLSRSDWAGTFPTVRTASQSVNADFISALGATSATGLSTSLTAAVFNDTSATPNVFTEKFRDLGKPYYRTTFPTMGAAGNLMGEDLIGVPYDDPLWEQFMNQWSATHYAQILRDTALVYNTHEVADKGIPFTFSSDGPFGFSRRGSYVDSGNNTTGRRWRTYACYTGAPMQAQTFNVELAYAMGRALGNEAMWGNGNRDQIQTGWYAPAMNTHRSQFSGRNFEYYGEDGRMGGLIASQIVIGAREKGLITNIKHFALNDQDTSRQTVATWADEQTMREIYFVPFELSIKQGKSLAVMTSMNRIGTNWATNDYRMLTELLRNEWGHKGIVITDYGVGTVNYMQRAGNGSSMGITNQAAVIDTTSPFWTPTHAWAMRQGAKDVAYAVVNSNAMQYYALSGNGASVTSSTVWQFMGSAEIINNSLIRTGNTEAGSNTVNNRQVKYKELEPLTAGELGGEYYASVKGATASDLIGTGNVWDSLAISPNPQGNSVSYNDGAPAFAATRAEADTTWWNVQTVSYSITAGSLPSGLTLNSKTGTISGTPTEDGTFNFTVTASAGKDSEFAPSSQDVSIFIEGDSSEFAYTARPLPEGVVTGDYDVSIEALRVNGNAYTDTTYALESGSSLPAGLTLASDGTISGTPTTEGSTTFTVRGTRTVGDNEPYSTTATFTINVNSLPTLNYGSAVAANGRVGQAYSASYAVNMSDNTYAASYEISYGRLPAGLTLNAATGQITGTPTASGQYTFQIMAKAAKDSVNLVPVINTFTVIIHSTDATISVEDFTATSATVGNAYAGYQIAATLPNNVSATYTITDGALPSGLSLNTATGQITGTPMAAGTFDFTVSVSSGGLATADTEGSITVAPGAITFDTAASLPNATANSQFLVEIKATAIAGESNALSFAVKSGTSLPSGVEMEQILDNGRVIGIELTGAIPAGTYTFTIVASADNHTSVERTFTLIVTAPSTPEPEPEEGGCNGMLAGSGIALFAMVLIGAAIMLVVRKAKKSEN